MNGNAQQTVPTPALTRLALSRERLRQALGGAAPARSGGAGEAAAPGHAEGPPPPAPPPGTFAGGWLSGLLTSPLARVLVDAVSGWWLQHPLRPVMAVAGVALTVTIQPVARRHPLALVAGAFMAGGLLAWFRPWRQLRRLAKPALFAGLAQQLMSKALAEVPLQSWLTAWEKLAQEPQPADASTATPGAAAQSPGAGS